MGNPDWDKQERKEQAEALLELLQLGEESRAAGKSMTPDEFMAKLRSRQEWQRDQQRLSSEHDHST